MATTLPELHATFGASVVPVDTMERLEELARKHGWTVDEAMSRALSLTEIVLDAQDEDPASKVYIYRSGKRYAVQIEE